MRCFVTGAGGFLGEYLCARLLRLGHEVDGLSLPGVPRRETEGVRWVEADLADDAGRSEIQAHLAARPPDWVFHLAAQSFPGRSWDEPAATFRANIGGTVNLLEALRRAAPAARAIVAGSSSEYAPADGPIAEDAPMRPASPYAVSKLATDQVARLCAERYGMAILRVRPFFLLGPGKTGDVSSDLARGIVAVEQGRAPDLAVGNLDAVRDFLDCRDGVAAFVSVAERGAPGGVYNVCSGTGTSVRALLDLFRSAARAAIPERVDPARLRPLDEPVKVGDNSRLRALGWAPEIGLEQSVRDILEYWRCRS